MALTSVTHSVKTRMPSRGPSQKLWHHPGEQRSHTQLWSLERRQGQAANLMCPPWPDGRCEQERDPKGWAGAGLHPPSCLKRDCAASLSWASDRSSSCRGLLSSLLSSLSFSFSPPLLLLPLAQQPPSRGGKHGGCWGSLVCQPAGGALTRHLAHCSLGESSLPPARALVRLKGHAQSWPTCLAPLTQGDALVFRGG